MKFLVRMGPMETKTIAIGTKIQLEHLLLNLCNNASFFARESSLGCILEISDEILQELYKSLPDNFASELPNTSQSQIVALFIQEFLRNRNLNKFAEIRFVSSLSCADAKNELFELLCASD